MNKFIRNLLEDMKEIKEIAVSFFLFSIIFINFFLVRAFASYIDVKDVDVVYPYSAQNTVYYLDRGRFGGDIFKYDSYGMDKSYRVLLDVEKNYIKYHKKELVDIAKDEEKLFPYSMKFKIGDMTYINYNTEEDDAILAEQGGADRITLKGHYYYRVPKEVYDFGMKNEPPIFKQYIDNLWWIKWVTIGIYLLVTVVAFLKYLY